MMSIGSLKSLWHYRRFIVGSVAREFKSRYARTIFGAAWLLLAPFSMIMVYTLVFSQIMQARLPGTQEPFAYSIYLCAGLLPWQWFSELLSRNVGIFVDNGGLIKKSNFPRLALPVIAFLASACNFALVAGLFMIFLLLMGRLPGWEILALIPLLLLQSAFALGLGITLGTLNVFFRDIGQAVGIVLQFWFWLTPIVYPLATLPAWARGYLSWNPVLPLFEAYQNVLLGVGPPQWSHLTNLAGMTVVTLFVAAWVYQAAQSQLADEV
jgi:lipopolysaccharide transport system permease protein